MEVAALVVRGNKQLAKLAFLRAGAIGQSYTEKEYYNGS